MCTASRSIPSLLVVLLLAWFAGDSRAATPEQIDAAIKRGVEFLYSTQNEWGSWEATEKDPQLLGMDGQWGGRTALAVYALLSAGEKPVDPRITKAVEWLRKAKITGHYALGVRANVWLHLPATAANRQAMTVDARLLLAGMSKAPKNRGFYNYEPNTQTSSDLSCSQYAVLGAWAAAQRNEPFGQDYWSLTENAWRALQAEDGGWGYQGKPSEKHPATIGMVAAGVATLFITQEFLHANDGIEGTKGNIVDPWINKGLAYVEAGFPALMAQPRQYALYGIERVGLASGYKYFGKIDWFAAGADVTVNRQNRKLGSWPDYGPTVGTSLAVLFLSRGRAPVMMNKLQYNITTGDKSVEANWNQRPRDVANAVRWTQDKTERPLNWQIINLNVGTIDDLNDSRLLYISGNQALSFTEKEKATLKQYIDEGGIIIGNADVAKPEFIKSYRALAAEFFPQYEFKKLSEMPDHPLMGNQQFKSNTWKKRPLVEAVSNGARLLMILIPSDDLSRTLQKRDANRPEHFELLANAFLYSINKEQTNYKGESHIVRADEKITPAGTVQVARLKYAGNWDPEPGGWRRLAAIAHNLDKVKLETQVVELGKDKLDSAVTKIAHLTGTQQFALTAEQRTALKAFVGGGGLLVIDSCGGGGEFDGAAQSELAHVFGADAQQLVSPMKSDHPLYSPVAEEKLEPKYRVYAMQKMGADLKGFRLKGISVGGKLGVIYSSEDLSVGLVGHGVDGIVGLEPETATLLMRRIIRLKTAGKI